MNRLFFVLVVFSFFQANAQNWQLEKALEVKNNITAVSVDFSGMLYVGTAGGTLIKIDPRTFEDQSFSFPNLSAISFIEAWNPLKVFLFMQDNQQFVYLERFLSDFRSYDINTISPGFSGFVFPGMDHSVWVLEQPQLILKKYNDTNLNLINTIYISQNLQLKNVTFAKSYQNLLLFSDDEQGFVILDVFGNLIFQYEMRNIRSVVTANDIAYLVHDNHLAALPLFQPADVEIIELPEGTQYAIRLGNHYLLMKGNTIGKYVLE